MNSTVLIVDDNSSLAYFTAFTLKQEIHGLEVITAGSCEEARLVADECNPSVFVVDLRLPDGDGLELVRSFKSRFPKMIPILITATPIKTHRDKDLFGLLAKPYDPQALIDLVRQALDAGNSGDSHAVESHGVEEAGKPSYEHDFHRVQNRLSGLLAGIRALRLELYAVANDPDEVRKIVDEYTDRLTAMIKDAGEVLKRGFGRR